MVYSVSGLCFAYESRPVLSSLTFTMESGMFYGLLGPNGCGKTTLLDILVGHRSPDAGDILFHGKPLADYSRKNLARSVALVAQNPVIHFPYKVKDLVLMGRHPYIGRFSSPTADDIMRVDQAMEQADVKHFEDALITELSGGERQRVLFARALAQDTPVLMLDEATSNLDICHSLGLLNCVRESVVKSGKTVISVFQDINLAALFCDRLLFMVDGSIHTQGPVQEVLTSNVISQVYGVESQVHDEPFSGARQVFFNRGGVQANAKGEAA